MDGALSGATAPGQTGPEINGNEGGLRIPQSPGITGTSPSECLVSYQDTHWGEYPSAGVQTLYSAAQANWVIYIYIYIYIYIPNTSRLTGGDIRSNFKWNVTELNSEF